MSRSMHIGDLHIGQRNICKYRPQFSSTEEHDGYLMDQLFSSCSKRDCLWLHGDIFIGNDWFEHAQSIVDYFGVVHYIIGNHDSDRKVRRSATEWMAVQPNVKIHSLVSRNKCWLSHHPIHYSELYGKINVHGHTHFTVIEDPHYFNVSADNIGLQPRNFQDIIAAARAKDYYAFKEDIN